MSGGVGTAPKAGRFARRTLLAGEAAARRRTMTGRQRFMRIVLVDREQAPLASAPNKHHAAAGAFAVPARALELRESIGEGAPQVGARRQLGCVEHVVEHVAQHEPACQARGGEGVVLAALGGHVATLSAPAGRRPFSSPQRTWLYKPPIAKQLKEFGSWATVRSMKRVQAILIFITVVLSAFFAVLLDFWLVDSRVMLLVP